MTEATTQKLHTYSDWHDDDGPVVWLRVCPIDGVDDLYFGTPLCSDCPFADQTDNTKARWVWMRIPNNELYNFMEQVEDED